MPRLPKVKREDLRGDQLEVWEQIVGGPRARAHSSTGGLVDSDGGLIGPFNAWVTSPAVGGPAARLGEAIRFHSLLDRRTVELIIVVVAVHWRAEFEFWAHKRYALEAGVGPELMDAITSGTPAGTGGGAVDDSSDDWLLVHACSEILTSGRLAPAPFQALIDRLGAEGVAEMVTIIGYYSLVSFNLNVFDISAPSSEDPA